MKDSLIKLIIPKNPCFLCSVQSKFDNFGYQLGLRNENTNITTIFNGYDVTNTPYTPITNLKNSKSYSLDFFLLYSWAIMLQIKANYHLITLEELDQDLSQLIPAYRLQNATNYFKKCRS